MALESAYFFTNERTFPSADSQRHIIVQLHLASLQITESKKRLSKVLESGPSSFTLLLFDCRI